MADRSFDDVIAEAEKSSAGLPKIDFTQRIVEPASTPSMNVVQPTEVDRRPSFDDVIRRAEKQVKDYENPPDAAEQWLQEEHPNLYAGRELAKEFLSYNIRSLGFGAVGPLNRLADSIKPEDEYMADPSSVPLVGEMVWGGPAMMAQWAALAPLAAASRLPALNAAIARRIPGAGAAVESLMSSGPGVREATKYVLEKGPQGAATMGLLNVTGRAAQGISDPNEGIGWTLLSSAGQYPGGALTGAAFEVAGGAMHGARTARAVKGAEKFVSGVEKGHMFPETRDVWGTNEQAIFNSKDQLTSYLRAKGVPEKEVEGLVGRYFAAEWPRKEGSFTLGEGKPAESFMSPEQSRAVQNKNGRVDWEMKDEPRKAPQGAPVEPVSEKIAATKEVPPVPVKSGKVAKGAVEKTLEPGVQGDCFGNVLKFVNRNSDPEMRVVHGKVRKLDGTIIDHAWVEKGDTVIDPTAGIELPKAKYYEATGAKAESTYDPAQTAKLAIRTNNMGPWTPEEVKAFGTLTEKPKRGAKGKKQAPIDEDGVAPVKTVTKGGVTRTIQDGPGIPQGTEIPRVPPKGSPVIPMSGGTGEMLTPKKQGEIPKGTRVKVLPKGPDPLTPSQTLELFRDTTKKLYEHEDGMEPKSLKKAWNRIRSQAEKTVGIQEVERVRVQEAELASERYVKAKRAAEEQAKKDNGGVELPESLNALHASRVRQVGFDNARPSEVRGFLKGLEREARRLGDVDIERRAQLAQDLYKSGKLKDDYAKTSEADLSALHRKAIDTEQFKKQLLGSTKELLDIEEKALKTSTNAPGSKIVGGRGPTIKQMSPEDTARIRASKKPQPTRPNRRPTGEPVKIRNYSGEKTLPPMVEKAVRWFEQEYPHMMSTFKTVDVGKMKKTKRVGQTTTRFGSLNMDMITGEKVLKIAYEPGMDPRKFVYNFAHELRHSAERRNYTIAKAKEMEPILRTTRPGDSFSDYASRPTEVKARRASEIALRKFEESEGDYLKQIMKEQGWIGFDESGPLPRRSISQHYKFTHSENYTMADVYERMKLAGYDVGANPTEMLHKMKQDQAAIAAGSEGGMIFPKKRQTPDVKKISEHYNQIIDDLNLSDRATREAVSTGDFTRPVERAVAEKEARLPKVGDPGMSVTDPVKINLVTPDSSIVTNELPMVKSKRGSGEPRAGETAISMENGEVVRKKGEKDIRFYERAYSPSKVAVEASPKTFLPIVEKGVDVMDNDRSLGLELAGMKRKFKLLRGDRGTYMTDLLKKEDASGVRMTEKDFDVAGLSNLEREFYRDGREVVKRIGEMMRDRGMSIRDMETHWPSMFSGNYRMVEVLPDGTEVTKWRGKSYDEGLSFADDLLKEDGSKKYIMTDVGRTSPDDTILMVPKDMRKNFLEEIRRYNGPETVEIETRTLEALKAERERFFGPGRSRSQNLSSYIKDPVEALGLYARQWNKKLLLDDFNKFAVETINKNPIDANKKNLKAMVKDYVQWINDPRTWLDRRLTDIEKATTWNGTSLVPANRMIRLMAKYSAISKLGYNPGSAFLNLTQTLFNTDTVLGTKWTTRGIKEGIEASMGFGKNLERNHKIIAQLVNDHELNTENLLGKYADMARYGKMNPLWLFSKTERANRIISALGEYYKSTEGKGLNHEQAILNARRSMVRTQFNMGQGDMPIMLRGDALRSVFQFKHFMWKELEFFEGLNGKEKTYFLTKVLGTLGLPAVPFITDPDTIDKLVRENPKISRGIFGAMGLDVSENYSPLSVSMRRWQDIVSPAVGGMIDLASAVKSGDPVKMRMAMRTLSPTQYNRLSDLTNQMDTGYTRHPGTLARGVKISPVGAVAQAAGFRQVEGGIIRDIERDIQSKREEEKIQRRVALDKYMAGGQLTPDERRLFQGGGLSTAIRNRRKELNTPEGRRILKSIRRSKRAQYRDTIEEYGLNE